MTEKLPPEEYYKTIPKKHHAAGVLIFNQSGEILIVKPSYKNYWEIPGGITDLNESLMQTANREAKEEIGIDVIITSLLCVDYKSARPPVTDSLQVIFDTVPLTQAQITDIRIDNNEIVEYGFYPVDKALTLLGEALSQRVAQAVKAKEAKTVFYLENGQNPFGNNR